MKIIYLRFMAINQCSVSISHLFIRFVFILSSYRCWFMSRSKRKCTALSAQNINSGSISSYVVRFFFFAFLEKNWKKNYCKFFFLHNLQSTDTPNRSTGRLATPIRLMKKTSANSNIMFIHWSVSWKRDREKKKENHRAISRYVVVSFFFSFDCDVRLI